MSTTGVAVSNIFSMRLVSGLGAAIAEVGAARGSARGQRPANDMRGAAMVTAKVFTAGDIDCKMFQTIVCRSDLTVDGGVGAVAPSSRSQAARWPSMTQPTGRPTSMQSWPAPTLRRQKGLWADRN